MNEESPFDLFFVNNTLCSGNGVTFIFDRATTRVKGIIYWPTRSRAWYDVIKLGSPSEQWGIGEFDSMRMIRHYT